MIPPAVILDSASVSTSLFEARCDDTRTTEWVYMLMLAYCTNNLYG